MYCILLITNPNAMACERNKHTYHHHRSPTFTIDPGGASSSVNVHEILLHICTVAKRYFNEE